MSEEVHICSLVVHARDHHAVAKQMKKIPELEIHGDNGQGKLVVVLEADSEWQLLEQIQTIRDIAEVYSASLVHHHCEKAETLEEEMHEDHTP